MSENRSWHSSRVSRERAGSASCISHLYTHTTPASACRINDFCCSDFLTFSDTSRGPYSVASSVSLTFSVCPLISLALFFFRPIDPIGSVFFFSFFRSLSQIFQSTIRYESLARSFCSFFFFSLFYPRSFSRTEALYGTTRDLRETRPYFAIVPFFKASFVLPFGYSRLLAVAEPNTTTG